jgi:dTDP-glucose 4,6-dehydratase
LIPLTILRAIAGKPPPIYGDGRNVRDWIYVDDHCEGILAVLRNGQIGEKYNIGGNSERTNLAIVDEICEVLEDLVPAADNSYMNARGASSYCELKTFVPDRPGHDYRYAVERSRMTRELQWRPGTELAEGLRLTASWYLRNREWCETVQRGCYAGERLGLQHTAAI